MDSRQADKTVSERWEVPKSRERRRIGGLGYDQSLRKNRFCTSYLQFGLRRGYRSGRCADGADGHRPNSRYDHRGEPPGGRSQDHGYDPHYEPSKCAHRCMRKDSVRKPPKHAPGPCHRRSDGASVHRAGNRHGHCAQGLYGHSSCRERGRDFRDDGTY